MEFRLQPVSPRIFLIQKILGEKFTLFEGNNFSSVNKWQ